MLTRAVARAESGPALEIRGLQKRYGDFVAVQDVTLDVARGEIYGILGPNGAGKTTTIECAQGLRNADAGTIRVLGLDVVRHVRALHGRVGSQLQASALPDRVKVGEALALFASLSAARTDIDDLLERWGLSEQRNTSFAALSGGQRQRLLVALALIGRPELVFLDELTQGLDPVARRVAWELIREVRDEGCAVVLVTHYMDEAEELCDRIALVDRGRVVASGTVSDLICTSEATTSVYFRCDDSDIRWLSTLKGVQSVAREGTNVKVAGTGELLAAVTTAMFDRGTPPADLRVEQPRLEDAYAQLTAAGEAPS